MCASFFLSFVGTDQWLSCLWHLFERSSKVWVFVLYASLYTFCIACLRTIPFFFCSQWHRQSHPCSFRYYTSFFRFFREQHIFSSDHMHSTIVTRACSFVAVQITAANPSGNIIWSRSSFAWLASVPFVHAALFAPWSIYLNSTVPFFYGDLLGHQAMFICWKWHFALMFRSKVLPRKYTTSLLSESPFVHFLHIFKSLCVCCSSPFMLLPIFFCSSSQTTHSWTGTTGRQTQPQKWL